MLYYGEDLIMELFTGGQYQGKTTYVRNLFPDIKYIDGRERSLIENEKLSFIWDDFEASITELVESGLDDAGIKERIISILQKNQGIIIISRETGNGVVPIDGEQRRCRELTGRILCEISGMADKVTRIVCGIPQKLK